MAKKEDTLKYIKTKVWPKTKKEMERGIKETKKMLNKGEKYLKNVSEKGLKQSKKLSLSLKKEKIYYDLGKAVAQTSLTQWSTNKRIDSLLKQIKSLNREIAKIK